MLQQSLEAIVRPIPPLTLQELDICRNSHCFFARSAGCRIMFQLDAAYAVDSNPLAKLLGWKRASDAQIINRQLREATPPEVCPKNFGSGRITVRVK